MTRRSKRLGIIVAVALIVVGVLAIYGLGLHEYIPKVRASAKSPDGSLTVMVYQQRLMPRPFFPRMGAIAKVYDRRGNTVYENTIFHDDDWDDTLGDAFNKIAFENDEIHIGPGAYDRNRPYVIRKSDLTLPD